MAHAKNFKDLTGLRFGKLTVVAFEKTIKKITYWLCKCDCGNTKILRGRDFRFGGTRACGCLEHAGHRFKDLTGQRFARLVVVKLKSIINRRARWECVCDCGNIKIVTTGDLRSGHTKSCGCLHRERAATMNVTHGMNRSPEWIVWQGILARCTKPNSPRYARYGGRGITYCERWKEFENFYADMGPRPPGTQIEREDNDGNYEPGNCKWIMKGQQQRNTSRSRWVTFQGKTLTLAEWGEQTGIPAPCIQQRLDRHHWPIKRALTEPTRIIRRRQTIQG